MKNKKKSHAKIVIADDTHIEASVEGVVPLFVLNTTKNPDVGLGTAVDVPGMVVPKLGQDLIAVTHFFEEMGYSVHLRPKGHCEFYRFDANGEKETIAIRWDAVEKGFFMDVVTSQNPDKHPLAAAHVMDLLEQRSTERVRARNAATLSEETLDQAIMVLQDLRGVTGIVTNDLAMKAQLQQARVAKHDDPLNCRLDLKGANGGMTREKAAKLFAHVGCVDPMCWVCRMVRGDKPYKLKVPAETRVRMEMPNFRLTLDFVQQGGNSFDGDNPRPLEVATNFRISRKQITKELSAYIPIGTPALTWNAEVNKDTAKGSDIHTSARWGIAKSMDRHVPQFFDPFTKATFHTG